MVRFKFNALSMYIALSQTSQFHYGSIQMSISHGRLNATSLVSIPLWFDSNWIYMKSHATSATSLNSTMVRFKFVDNNNTATHVYVSIPLWFDSNIEQLKNESEFFSQSQFHYGSIQIRRLRRIGPRMDRVSIPLWFDSNFGFSEIDDAVKCGLNSTMVRFKCSTKHFGK